MARAVVVTVAQAKALESLVRNGAVSASDFDRAALEQLVNRYMAIKQQNGLAVTYSISPLGRTVWNSLFSN